MKEKRKIPILNRTALPIAGILAILLLALSLLWNGKASIYQPMDSLVAKVYFDGEYRIADGPWQELVEGVHIPATKGDVTLRGHFHMLAPDGSYQGIYRDELPVALFVDHLQLTFYEGNNPPYMVDPENPIYGEYNCGESWWLWIPAYEASEQLEIVIHNPHRYGNETAVDALLASVGLWTGTDFEKTILNSGETQRDVGLSFMVISAVLLGIALFSSLIHIKNSKQLWLFGMVILFAGIYLAYSADGVSVWRTSVISNTTILGSAMILYMLFLSVAIVCFLEKTKTLGVSAVLCLGVVDGIIFAMPLLTDVLFYDTWLYWVIAQLVVNILLLICLVKECLNTKGQKIWLYIGAILPLLAFAADGLMTGLGVWDGGIASGYVFVLLFVAAMVAVLQIIPRGINAATKAKELETEKTVLNAQLAESRISTMMSQIRPHFIYNTLGSIEQLCEIDPEKAGELVHNFAKYLRGNFGELDNPRPILMSQEMEHVQYYISIEKVRFPDMTFLFEMGSVDFRLPALTIQPIVENAVKHGLMKRDKGGTIRVVSYETDTHYCVSVEDDGVGFDPQLLQDSRAHMGIRNIRERLKAMVNGTVEIQSTLGVGTKVLITIPKEEQK